MPTIVDLEQNYFSLFQLPENYAIDLVMLKERYHALQKQVHPDRFAAGNDEEKRLAVEYSTHINEAFNTLKSPIARAQYLLLLKGIVCDEQQTVNNDADFLMQQMTMREQMAALKEHKSPQRALNLLSRELERHITQQCDIFKERFSQGGYKAASEAVMKMQFFYKLQSELEENL